MVCFVGYQQNLAHIAALFDVEEIQWEQRKKLFSRFPNVSAQEYVELIPHLWIEDKWSGDGLTQEQLCHMPYGLFLGTQYWKSISAEVKRRHPFCVLCFEYLQQLHVHHETYVRRGLEWMNDFADLEVLCHSCHRAQHGRRSA